MSENTIIPDQEDILAINQRLEAENTRLTGELKASTELLEMSQEDLTTATQRASQLSERVNVLEIAAKVAGEELTRLKADNVALTARMADFNKALASEVVKLGLNAAAAEHKEAPADTDLTPTQRVLAVKGVNTLADLNRK